MCLLQHGGIVEHTVMWNGYVVKIVVTFQALNRNVYLLVTCHQHETGWVKIRNHWNVAVKFKIKIKNLLTCLADGKKSCGDETIVFQWYLKLEFQ